MEKVREFSVSLTNPGNYADYIPKPLAEKQVIPFPHFNRCLEHATEPLRCKKCLPTPNEMVEEIESRIGNPTLLHHWRSTKQRIQTNNIIFPAFCPKCKLFYMTQSGKLNSCPHETLGKHVPEELFEMVYLTSLIEDYQDLKSKYLAFPRKNKSSLHGVSQIELDLAQELNSPSAPRVPVKWGNRKVASADILYQNEIVIEYDGYYWHKDRKARDQSKTKAFLEAGYDVIRVRDSETKKLTLPSLGIDHPRYREILVNPLKRGNVPYIAQQVKQEIKSLQLSKDMRQRYVS